LAVLLAVFCLIALASGSSSREMVFSTLLVFIGFLLLAWCEVFYLKDLFSSGNNQSPLHRMNTVFKFHYQVWIFFSIAIGPFLKWIMENLWPKWRTWKKAAWAGITGFAFLGAFLYPVMAFTARLQGTSADQATMNGAAFYERMFPTNYQAAVWISQNVKPVGGKSPVILEAWGRSYHQEENCLATLTGYPTVLGWDFHEVQWRGSGDKTVIRGGDPNDTIMKREADIDAIYTSADLNQTRDLLRKYKVDYVYVGDAERQKYKDRAENLGKFVQLGSLIRSWGNAVLYKVNP
jgi:uncharacterized membrane protein